MFQDIDIQPEINNAHLINRFKENKSFLLHNLFQETKKFKQYEIECKIVFF